MKIVLAVPFLIFSFGVAGAAPKSEGRYDEVRNELMATEQVSREVMGSLYNINRRMKNISKRRDQITDKSISAEFKVKHLSESTHELESTLSEQKKHLSKKLRTLYILGEDKVARAIFSANNSEDIQKTLKYLKIFSEQDLRLIKTYESNLSILKNKKERLDNELKKLLVLRKQLEKQESLLTKDQDAKSDFLKHLNSKKGAALARLKTIRKKLGPDAELLLDFSFFEQKGRLSRPMRGYLTREYGLIENEEYGYQLSHKGQLYSSSETTPVRAIYRGRVSFAGELEGHGKTIILDHGDHYYSVYSGLSKLDVVEGDTLESGQEISDKENGVYFEIRHFSDAIDPADWLQKTRGDS